MAQRSAYGLPGGPVELLDASATAVARRRPKRGRTWTAGQPVRLSILMPVFNEERTLTDAIAALLAVDYPCGVELIVVDDGSTDGTARILDGMTDPCLGVVHHDRNRGKGAALRTAAARATGTHVVPFDADLEYEPADLPALLRPVIEGRCDVVYGTRIFGVRTVYQSYGHAMGNRLLTTTANLLFDSYISDLHTCLKLVPRVLFRSLELSESGFGLDTEMTAKILKLGVRPFEVPVAYYSRSVTEGKKITWRDGLTCLQLLSRIRFAQTEAIRMEAFAAPVAGDGRRLAEFARATGGPPPIHWASVARSRGHPGPRRREGPPELVPRSAPQDVAVTPIPSRADALVSR